MKRTLEHVYERQMSASSMATEREPFHDSELEHEARSKPQHQAREGAEGRIKGDRGTAEDAVLKREPFHDSELELELELEARSKPQLKAREDAEGRIKGVWGTAEDAVLKRAVAIHGLAWKNVQGMVRGRSLKQCRERYRMRLAPDLKLGPFSKEEDDEVAHLQTVHGRRWTKIAEEMPGRTADSIKARVASLARTERKKWSQEEDRMLRSCCERNIGDNDVCEKLFPDRSLHAIRKRRVHLYLDDYADNLRIKISSGLPSNTAAVAATVSALYSAVGSPATASTLASTFALAAGGAKASNSAVAAQASFALEYELAPTRTEAASTSASAPRGSPVFFCAQTPVVHPLRQEDQPLDEFHSASPGGAQATFEELRLSPIALRSESRWQPEDAHVLRGNNSCSSSSSCIDGRGGVRGLPLQHTGFSSRLNRYASSGLASLDFRDSPTAQAAAVVMPAAANHPFAFPATAGENVTGASAVSRRSGNLKRQSTSVTIMQQIIQEPLRST